MAHMMQNIQITCQQQYLISINFPKYTMKSPRSLTPMSSISHKQQDHPDNQLILTIGNQLSESSKIIYNIKQSLYQLMKINVSATVPVRKYDSAPAIVAGSKRNLDDLRRIQSMIKGYLNTIRLEYDQSISQEDIDTKLGSNRSVSVQNSSSPNTSKIFTQTQVARQSKPNTQPQQPSQQPITTIFTTTPPLPGAISPITKTDSHNNTTNQVNMSTISEIKESSKFNMAVRRNMEKIGDREELGNILEDQDNQGVKIEAINDTKLDRNVNPGVGTSRDSKMKANSPIHSQVSPPKYTSPSLKQPTINTTPQEPPQSPSSPSDLNIKIPQLQQNIFSTKDKKLKSCKSAIFSASRNLHDIRSRNRQCLELIRSIKKQIGIRQQL